MQWLYSEIFNDDRIIDIDSQSAMALDMCGIFMVDFGNFVTVTLLWNWQLKWNEEMPWKTQKQPLCELGIEEVDLKYQKKQFDKYILITVPQYYDYFITILLLLFGIVFGIYLNSFLCTLLPCQCVCTFFMSVFNSSFICQIIFCLIMLYYLIYQVISHNLNCVILRADFLSIHDE